MKAIFVLVLAFVFALGISGRTTVSPVVPANSFGKPLSIHFRADTDPNFRVSYRYGSEVMWLAAFRSMSVQL